MRTTSNVPDNSGGLCKIIAIPPSNINKVELISSGLYKLVLKDNRDLFILDCLPVDAGFQENRQESDSGDVYSVEISGFIYGMSADNMEIVNILDSGTWTVVCMDAEGVWFAFGTNRVNLVFERKKTTSNSRTGLKGTSFSFSCEDEYPGLQIQPLII